MPSLVSQILVCAACSWSALLQNDLKAMHDTLAANHPGTVDPLGDAFRAQLQNGYDAALAQAATVTDEAGAQAVLRAYAAGFADVHLGYAPATLPSQLTWPGFLLTRRSGAPVVPAAPAGNKHLPRRGWQMLGCDDVDAESLLTRDVLPYYDLRPQLEATRAAYTPLMLVFGLDGRRAPYKTCTFKEPDGTVHTLPLTWRPSTTVELLPQLQAAAFGPTPPLGAAEVRPRRHWLNLSTFSPQSPQAEDGLRAVIAAAGKLQDAEMIVLDVRGNSGGNSLWGYELVKSLYGAQIAAQAAATAAGASYAEWRASPGNRGYISAILPGIEAQFGAQSSEVLNLKQVVADMTTALAQGKSYVTVSDPPSPSQPPVSAPPVTAKVILLTDGLCVSACLDFADLLRAIPGTLQAGQPTSADTFYMDLRRLTLPSGLGTLRFPMKVYRQRPRGSNDPLLPDLPYTGDISDTAALQAWLLSM